MANGPPSVLPLETPDPAVSRADAAFRRAYLGLFGFALAGWMLAFVALARSGLERPPRLTLTCLLVLGAAALAPSLVPAAWSRRGLDWQAPVVALAMLGTPLLTPVLGAVLLPILGVTLLAGSVAALRRVAGAGALELVWLLLGPLALAVYLFVEFHGRFFAHVYAPELARLGVLSADTLFHAAVTHMIQRFAAVSTGLDGLVPLAYHAGSHVWFATLGRLAGSDPLLTYPYAQLGVTLPALVLSLLFAVGALLSSRRHLGLALALTLSVMLVSDLVGWNAHYTSESQALGLCILLASLPLLLFCLWTPSDSDARHLALLLALVFLGICVKVSIGVVLGAAVAWVALRGFGPGKRLAAAVAGLLVIALFAQRELMPATAFSISFLEFYRNAAPEPFGLYAGWTSPLLPLGSVLLLLLASRTPGASLDLRRRARLTIGLVCVVTGVSLLPSVFSAVPTPEPWWFANAGHWFALPIFVACLDRWWQLPSTRGAAKIAIAVLLTGCALFWWLRVGPDRLAEQQAPVLQALGMLEPPARRAVGSLLPKPLGGRLRLGEELARGRDALLARSLGEATLAEIARALPGEAAPRDVVIFVPPTNRVIWKTGSGGCYRRPLLLPALTGLPLIQGLPPNCPAVVEAYGWGFSGYGEDARSRATSDAALCARASERGFARVFVLASLRDRQQNRLLSCEARRRP